MAMTFNVTDKVFHIQVEYAIGIILKKNNNLYQIPISFIIQSNVVLKKTLNKVVPQQLLL